MEGSPILNSVLQETEGSRRLGTPPYTFCQKKAQDFLAEESVAWDKSSAASAELQRQPHDPVAQNLHGEARLHLQDVESKKVAGQRIRTRLW